MDGTATGFEPPEVYHFALPRYFRVLPETEV